MNVRDYELEMQNENSAEEDPFRKPQFKLKKNEIKS